MSIRKVGGNGKTLVTVDWSARAGQVLSATLRVPVSISTTSMAVLSDPLHTTTY